MFPELYLPSIHYTDISLNILKERFNSVDVGILVNVYKVVKELIYHHWTLYYFQIIWVHQ